MMVYYGATIILVIGQFIAGHVTYLTNEVTGSYGHLTSIHIGMIGMIFYALCSI